MRVAILFLCAIVEAQNVVSETNTGTFTGTFVDEKMPSSYKLTT